MNKKLNIAILGYPNDLVGRWDPSTIETGLPGSEECVVYAAQELVNRGHNVTVYMNPPEQSKWNTISSNPCWVFVYEWFSVKNKDFYDLVIMWRRLNVEMGKQRSSTVFFWPHDSPASTNIPNMIFPKFDGVCVLSKYHHQQLTAAYPKYNTIPYTICGNGIILKQFENALNTDRNPYSIGYFSNYARGLVVLLVIWPDIIKEFPDATLDICYGKETWHTDEKGFMEFVDKKFEEYKNQGVVDHGKVGHCKLADIMKSTSIWAYPCTVTTETFCITAVKCQAAGCIPVTTRIGALDETVHPQAPQIPTIVNQYDVDQYKQLLLTTLRNIRDNSLEKIQEERIKYINFANQFSWEFCVDKWLELYNFINSL